MAPDDDPHDLEIENEKPDDLPWEELAPESCCTGWSGRKGYLFRARGDVFFLHMIFSGIMIDTAIFDQVHQFKLRL